MRETEVVATGFATGANAGVPMKIGMSPSQGMDRSYSTNNEAMIRVSRQMLYDAGFAPLSGGILA